MSCVTNITVPSRAETLSRTKAPTVLIVDNDEDVLVTLERVLEDHGFATATAVSYEEASTLLSRNAFEVLVLDDYLSDRDSVDFLADLRGSFLMPSAVVVTYHKIPSQDMQARLQLLGVNALVNKRAHAELAQLIRYALAGGSAPPLEEEVSW